ncbi:unnamed protein product [Withania somnifera]
MGSEGSEKDLVVTQISIGGFGNDVDAKKLSGYLEEQVGQVWRCRLERKRVQRMNDYKKVEPHAFVHFASSVSAKYALAAAGHNELLLEEKPLEVSLGPGNPFWLNERRRTTMPKFSDVNIEIGVLVGNDVFVVGWRGPHTGVNFLVDPFNGTCKTLFTKDTVFSFQGEARCAVIKCYFKIQFFLREINEIKECKDFASLVILLQLGSSPLVYYRTAADDVEESVTFDLLDDEDQWIRTTDITCSGAIGRCNTYCISIQPRNEMNLILGCPCQNLQNHDGISFKVLFLVNVVLHKSIINQRQMTNEFLLTNPNLLERIGESDDVLEVRRLVITPTKAYFLRNYKHVSDRFLRVTFMDEGMRNLNRNVLTYYATNFVREITSNSNPQRSAILQRVKSILSKGFYLCRRKYSFLAFSANQLRDHSAWFFAEVPKIRVTSITSWMGKFGNRNIAKCAARMGQCFSSTYVTVEVLPGEVNSQLPDIERNGYVFSDGIGMMSADLAIEVADKLQLSVNPPCAYQIRYAGCKGVVACWLAKNDDHTILEICSWTRFQPGFLNRQIVTLLSSLKQMLSRLDKILVAFDVITASCAEAGNTAAIMLSAVFEPQNEPHLKGMLRIRQGYFVPSGKWLMGCLDELGELEQGQCFIQVSSPSLENCFVKHGPTFSDIKKILQGIKGLVVISKNPCLHPGDVEDSGGCRWGQATSKCEASGSDLDGDLYFVTWDENLIPPSKKSWMPMDYAPAELRQLDRQVQHADIIQFFSKNMVQESLGEICNAHVVHADLCELGALDEKCLKLAELAALAVDFPKTGKLSPCHLTSNRKWWRICCGIPDDTTLEILGYEDFMHDAWNRICSCDVQGEEEVVIGHIWSIPKYTAKKQGELKKRLKHAYNMLRKEFRNVSEHMEPDFDQLPIDEKNDLYERKASAWYRVTYHPHWVTKSLDFAWITADYLARIKIKRRGMQHADSTKPINSLGRYIVGKI